MPILRVTSQDASTNDTDGGTSVVATYPATPTQGNLLIATVRNLTGGATNATSAITGWTASARRSWGGTSRGAIQVFYKVAGAGESTTVTCNFTVATPTESQLILYEYSGFNTPVADQENGTALATVTALPSGDVVTTASEELLFTAFGTDVNTTAHALNNSFTIITNDLSNCTTGNRIVATTGTYSVTGSWTTTARGALTLITFKGGGARSITGVSSITRLTSIRL